MGPFCPKALGGPILKNTVFALIVKKNKKKRER